MKKLLLMSVLLTPFFSHGNTIFGYQKECEKTNNSFPTMVDCLSKSIKQDGYLSSNPDALLYAAQANSLAGKAKRKEIYAEDAALDLQEKYNNLNARINARNAPKENEVVSIIKDRLRRGPAPRQQQQNIIIAPQQQQKNCSTPGGPVNYYCIYGQ